jgi:hypothetical protein
MAIRSWLRTKAKSAEGADSQSRVENVLVQYVGHGMFKPNSEEYYLSINTTDAEDRWMTSASLGQLNQILLTNTPRRRRIYLIDACFAAAFTMNLMSPPEEAVEVKLGAIVGAWPDGEWSSSGVAALCSAGRTEIASARGQRGLTQFTDGLLSVFETGDNASEFDLSLRRIYQILRDTLSARYLERAIHPVLVAPEDRDGGIGSAPIFPNLAGRGLDPDWITRTFGPVAPSESPVDAVSATSVSNSHDLAEASMLSRASGAEPSSWSVAVGETPAVEREATLSPEQHFRQVAYRFFRLPHSKKDEIVRNLAIAGDIGEAQSDLERYKVALAKARETGAVNRLESLIVKAERG